MSSVCVCVCVCERERERESGECVCMMGWRCAHHAQSITLPVGSYMPTSQTMSCVSGA